MKQGNKRHSRPEVSRLWRCFEKSFVAIANNLLHHYRLKAFSRPKNKGKDFEDLKHHDYEGALKKFVAIANNLLHHYRFQEFERPKNKGKDFED